MAAFPQRLEAANDCAAVTARVKLVPFPFVPTQAADSPETLSEGSIGRSQALKTCSSRIKFDQEISGNYKERSL